MKRHKTFNSDSVDKSYHAITIPLLNRETKSTTHLNETAEKRENQILKKGMETWRKIKYTMKQKKKRNEDKYCIHGTRPILF